MIFARPNHIPVPVLERLESLLTLLTEHRTEFEQFAQQVYDRGSRDSILELAQECNQYAHELLSLFETMASRIIQENTITIQEPVELMQDERAVLNSCQVSEQKIITAYRRLLNEPYLDENLRNLLRNQLQGLTCAFMKIKLLNSLLAQ